MWEALCGKRTKQAVALAVLFVLMFIGGCFFVKANQAKEFEKNDYVAKYRERYGAIDQIMTGANQESVWSSIDFDSGTFGEQTSETRDYFCKYLETCKADGVEVYLLEYTTNQKLIKKIKEYCKEQDFHFYISSSLELR